MQGGVVIIQRQKTRKSVGCLRVNGGGTKLEDHCGIRYGYVRNHGKRVRDWDVPELTHQYK